MTEELTNKAVTGNDASFAYQVGKDMVANEMAIKDAEAQIVELRESAAVLRDSLHTLKITVPAKPDAKFNRINADVELPEEFQNNLCLLPTASSKFNAVLIWHSNAALPSKRFI